MDAVRSEV